MRKNIAKLIVGVTGIGAVVLIAAITAQMVNREMKDHFSIRSVPATFLYHPDGELIEFFRGQVKAEILCSHVNAIVEEAE